MKIQLAVLALLSGCLSPTQESQPVHACTAAEFPLPFKSCGGDVTGNWQLSCYQMPPDRFTMTTPPVEHWSYKPDGQYVFSSENDYELMVTSSSAPDDGGCALFNERASLYGGTCADAGVDECRCNYSADGLTNTGSYSMSDDHLIRTFKPSPQSLGFKETSEYCVSGDTLTLPTRFGNFIEAGVFVRE